MIGRKPFGCCLLLSAAVLAGEVAAQPPRSNSKTITWQSPQKSQQIQVGILGEIAKPGVYQVDVGSLTVQTLVRRAGGLTEDAASSIRIVRQDRVVQSLFFSPQADSPLMPGDVLIVDSKQTLSAISKVMDGGSLSNPIHQTAASTSDPTGVQVAYINVLDAPVVVKLHREDARLERVVQMLGQPIELAGAVKIIDPQRASHATAQVASGTLRLTDGSVLVFPKGSINRSRLPSLPKPHESEIATGALPSMIGGPLGQAPELRSVGQLAPQMVLPHYDSTAALNSTLPVKRAQAPAIAPSPAISIAAPAPPFEPQSAPIPVASSRPRIANLPFTGAAPMRSSSSIGTIESDSIAPPPLDDLQRRSVARKHSASDETSPITPASNSQRDDKASNSVLSQGPEPVGTSPFSIFQMFGIFAGVSALIGAAPLARKYFDRPATDESLVNLRSESLISQPTPNSSESRTDGAIASEAAVFAPTALQKALAVAETVPANKLDRLIRNEFPLREEAAVFPESIVLQGRIAPRPIHRIDRAAETAIGSGPHFDTPANSSASTLQESAATELDVHSTSEALVSGPHFGMRRRDTQPTIPIGEASHATSATPRAAAAFTPLADALRQLQGERSS